MARTVVVVGASGLVGAATVDRFLEDGWDVVAVSRRQPEIFGDRPFRHIPIDLRDEADCVAKLSTLETASHLVYTAVHEKEGLISGWGEQDQIETNAAMFANTLKPFLARPGLEHVTLLQGTKAYGIHLHPMPIPARERYPRDEHPNFYWRQEDHLKQMAVKHGFGYTIFRPQLIVGPNYGVVMNLPPVIGVYAAICREEGRPFSFPGGAPYVWEAVDTRLVASAIHWAAEEQAAWGEHFNLTNGEVFSWRDVWPEMAEVLGVDPGPDVPLSLADFLPKKAAIWDEIVERYGLRKVPMGELLGQSHYYADFCFAYGATAPPPPAFVSTVKIKQAGFTETWDTAQSFRHWLRVLMQRNVLPPANR